jgi:hypothetical protein
VRKEADACPGGLWQCWWDERRERVVTRLGPTTITIFLNIIIGSSSPQRHSPVFVTPCDWQMGVVSSAYIMIDVSLAADLYVCALNGTGYNLATASGALVTTDTTMTWTTATVKGTSLTPLSQYCVNQTVIIDYPAYPYDTWTFQKDGADRFPGVSLHSGCAYDLMLGLDLNAYMRCPSLQGLYVLLINPDSSNEYSIPFANLASSAYIYSEDDISLVYLPEGSARTQLAKQMYGLS